MTGSFSSQSALPVCHPPEPLATQRAAVTYRCRDALPVAKSLVFQGEWGVCRFAFILPTLPLSLCAVRPPVRGVFSRPGSYPPDQGRKRSDDNADTRHGWRTYTELQLDAGARADAQSHSQNPHQGWGLKPEPQPDTGTGAGVHSRAHGQNPHQGWRTYTEPQPDASADTGADTQSHGQNPRQGWHRSLQPQPDAGTHQSAVVPLPAARWEKPGRRLACREREDAQGEERGSRMYFWPYVWSQNLYL